MNPCAPSPCGPNSQCRDLNGQAVCSCLENYIGVAPSCRPECVLSTECSADKACISQRCQDPCPGTCGINADCRVRNHSPLCQCMSRFTGDAFTRCYPIPRNKNFCQLEKLNLQFLFIQLQLQLLNKSKRILVFLRHVAQTRNVEILME